MRYRRLAGKWERSVGEIATIKPQDLNTKLFRVIDASDDRLLLEEVHDVEMWPSNRFVLITTDQRESSGMPAYLDYRRLAGGD